jgi:CheY-like chemotaxis protein
MGKVLVIEDDPGFQELMPMLLRPHEVVVCSNSEEGLVKLDTGVFDVVICDLELLGLSGLDFLRQRKNLGLIDKPPIVICTSMTDPQVREKVVAEGAAGFVNKPFNQKAFETLINGLIPE